MAEKEIRLCKNIAKFSQNLPFQLAKFCILDAKFDFFFFCKKPRGQVGEKKRKKEKNRTEKKIFSR